MTDERRTGVGIGRDARTARRAPLWLRLLVLAAAVVAVVATCSRIGAAAPVALRASMQEIFGALRVLAPIAYREGSFGGRRDDARVEDALATLERGADSLEVHAVSRDPGFAHLAHGLAVRAATANELVEAGRDEDARRLVRGIVAECVACHTRNPSASDFEPGSELLREIGVASLPARERAGLELATRQLEPALASFEALFAEDGLDVLGAPDPAFVHYLAACLSIGARDRAIATLRALRARPDAKASLVEDADAWIRSLERLGAESEVGPRLDRARRLVLRGADVAKNGDERSALVYDLEARLELQRYLESESELSPDVAEAYYWMGVLEERIWDRPWLANAAPFFEQSIRIDPGAPFARDAYERLERIWVLGYTGSGGTRLPPAVQQRLRSLDRAVREAARS